MSKWLHSDLAGPQHSQRGEYGVDLEKHLTDVVSLQWELSGSFLPLSFCLEDIMISRDRETADNSELSNRGSEVSVWASDCTALPQIIATISTFAFR